MNRKWKSHVEVALIYLFIAFMFVVIAYPLLWAISMSLNPGTSLYSASLIPEKWTFEHYKWLFTSPQSDYLLWYKTSLFVAAANAVLSVFFHGAHRLCVFALQIRRAENGAVFVFSVANVSVAHGDGRDLYFAQYAPFARFALGAHSYLRRGVKSRLTRGWSKATLIRFRASWMRRRASTVPATSASFSALCCP